jgi:bacterioferritin (cytochrome b1)
VAEHLMMHPLPAIKLGDRQLATTKEHTEYVEAQMGIIIMAGQLQYMDKVMNHDFFTFCQA